MTDKPNLSAVFECIDIVLEDAKGLRIKDDVILARAATAQLKKLIRENERLRKEAAENENSRHRGTR